MLIVKYSGRINEFGRKVASFPIHPRYGKMIVMATESKENILSYIITIVAALTVGVCFVGWFLIITKPFYFLHS